MRGEKHMPMNDRELSLTNMIQIDMTLTSEIKYTIEGNYSISFHELHNVICRELMLDETQSYSFYLPKLQMDIRQVLRSSSISSKTPLLSIIQVGDDLLYYYKEAKYRLRIRSLGERINEPNLKLHLMRAQMKLSASSSKDIVLPRNQLNPQAKDILFKIATDLFKDEIFEYFMNGSLLVYHVRDELYYVFIENTISNYQILFFDSEASFQRYLCVKKDSLPYANIDKYKEGTSLTYSRYSQPNLPYIKISNTYITYQHHKRGYPTDQVGNEESISLFIYLQILSTALKKMKIFPISYDSLHQAMHIFFDETTKKSDIRIYPLIYKPLVAQANNKKNNLAQLLKIHKSEDAFELDYVLQNQQKHFDKNLRYPMSIHAICANAVTLVKRVVTYHTETDIINILQDLFMDVIEQHGRFKVLIVKERYVYSILVRLCQKLQMEIRICPNLPYIEQAFTTRKRPHYNMRPYR